MIVRWFEMPNHRRGLDPIPLQVSIVADLCKEPIRKHVPVKASWWDLPHVAFIGSARALQGMREHLASCGDDQVVFWCRCLKDGDDWQVFVLRATAVSNNGLEKFQECAPLWWTAPAQKEATTPRTAHHWITGVD